MKETPNSKGFTLVELLVVMVIFITVIIISTYAFENILKKSGQQSKAAESEISGIVGLEMMRSDIAAAGYGLPWSFPESLTPDYSTEVTGNLMLDIESTAFNDDPSVDSKNVPRAILSGTGDSGIDYLVVKGTVLGMNQTSRKWNYVNYSSSSKSYLKLRNDPSTDLGTPSTSTDRAITIIQKFTQTGVETKELAVKSDKKYFYTVPTTVPRVLGVDAAFLPTDQNQVAVAYGVSDSDIRMPYNRIDFYVNLASTKPASCSSGTGVLFKAVVNHTSGGYDTPYPLLDCVGDLQVCYDRDEKNDGNIALIDAPFIATMKADEIRTQIKNVRVYVLAHEGKKDPNFSYPVNDANNVICVGPYVGAACSSVGRNWKKTDLESTFGSEWMHYRWKVYNFVVNLKNLQ